MISYLRPMLLRVSYILWFSTLAIGAYTAYQLLRDVPISAVAYQGAASCGSCHSSERTGGAYGVWVRSKHAVAYQSMRNALSQNSGVGDSADCYRCHTTLGRPPATAAEQPVVAEGIGCERCHGPGSEYSQYSHMVSESLFLANGGVKGSLSDCGQCHIASSERPHCTTSSATTNANKLWEQIQHHTADTIRAADSIITNQ